MDCLTIPGYEFWIESNQKRATQYQTQETNEPTGRVVSCYTASEVGKEFRIGLRKDRDAQSTRIKFYLNDDCVDQRILRTPKTYNMFVSHVYTSGATEKRGFAFSTINFEEDDATELTSISKNHGTIRLEIFRITNVRSTHSGPPRCNAATLNVPTLSEKSKTINPHTISLRNPEEVGNKSFNYYTYDYMDSPKETPWYTVKFLYGPLDILQAKGIAPISVLKPAPNSESLERQIDQPTRVLDFYCKDQKLKIIKFKCPTKVTSSKETTVIEEDLPDPATLFTVKKENIKIETFSSPKRPRESLLTINSRAERIKRKGGGYSKSLTAQLGARAGKEGQSKS
ncbi:hypothetical protein Clacol_006158 [Clathrus columnatus]|uniref:DUF7918 domain-containing protein n=1 Tax=Clathrus columnatus TaxID=1419009 RepID=A0AAV5AIZ2_9AGAM|nr:hypothetical protein Clacol_006158 [Clathrus columnatus]